MTDRAITFRRVPVPLQNPLLDLALQADPNIVRRGLLAARHDRGYWSDGPLNIHAPMWTQRHILQANYAWAIPTQEAVDAIAEWCAPAGVVEIGAGAGYWAWMLQQAGVDVVAYDIEPGLNHWVTRGECFAPVRVGGAHVASKHPDRTLFLCWPLMNGMAMDALRCYRGSRAVYVGEWGGCTGDDEFHATLERDWTQVRCVDLPQWWGLHDAMWLLQRGRVRRKED